MRMEHEILPPGVQHGQETDAGPEVRRIGRDGKEGLSGRLKKELIDHLPVRQRQITESRGESKDDMEVWYGKKFLGPCLEPLGPCLPLALGTMAIATGVIGQALMAAAVALLPVPSQGRGATLKESCENLPLRGRSHRAEAGLVAGSLLADDVGYFQPTGSHAPGPSWCKWAKRWQRPSRPGDRWLAATWR